MVIGITGSSGAGKSTACEILEQKYHFKIITADEIAKELSKKGTPYLSEIVAKFGNDILLENGELNRRKLADMIYQNEEKRKQLNECTLKYIKKEIEEKVKAIDVTLVDPDAPVEELEKADRSNSISMEIDKNLKKLIAIDAPLLFEAGLDKICDITIAIVSADRNKQIQRMMERDNIDKAHATARLNAQHSNEFYMSKCQYTITNDEKKEDMEIQLEQILQKH